MYCRQSHGIRVQNRRKKIGAMLEVCVYIEYILPLSPGVWYAWRDEKISLRVERIQASFKICKTSGSCWSCCRP